MFSQHETGFWLRAQQKKGGFIVGGHNYGQGSSREHAALAPKYLGVKAVIAKSFARIHKANLVNFGIVPAVFSDPGDYDHIAQGDTLSLDLGGLSEVTLTNVTQNRRIGVRLELGETEKEVLMHGGKLAYIKAEAGAE